MNRSRLLLLTLLPAALPAPAHAAELRVRLSRSVTGRYESVGVRVLDPLRGLDVRPGPLALTMADAADRRQTFFLEPTGRPGEWYGRFTPFGVGRYTGTVVLERAGSRDIGLVPVVRVRPTRHPGFLRLHPSSGRLLRWSNAGGFFPIGVRLSREDLHAVIDWRAELARLRARGINYLEVPAVWPGALTDGEREAELRRVDALLLLAERLGGIGVQVDLLAPEGAGADPEAYAVQLGHWVRRWSYSPAVALWNVAGATDAVAPDVSSRWVRAVRSADGYGHPVAVPAAGSGSQGRAGADLQVLPADWQRPVQRFAILEAPELPPDASPLPGETTWQLLAVGGIGVPVQPFHPGGRDLGVAALQSRLAAAARSIPFQAPVRRITDVLAVDTPGTIAQYGAVLSGWVAPDAARSLTFRTLPKGRYRARFWDPSTNMGRGANAVWSDGSRCVVRLPADLRTVYFQVEPISGRRFGVPAAHGVRHPAPPAALRGVPAPVPVRTVRVRVVHRRGRRAVVREVVRPAVRVTRRSMAVRPVRLTRAQRLAARQTQHQRHLAALHEKHLAALHEKHLVALHQRHLAAQHQRNLAAREHAARKHGRGAAAKRKAVKVNKSVPARQRVKTKQAGARSKKLRVRQHRRR